MKKFLSLFAVAAMALSAMATEFTVFDGTDQNQYIPFRATYFDYSPYCSQVIYPAAELTALQGKAISGIKFYVANETGNVMSGGELSLYLGATDKEAFPSYSPTRIPESDLTLVAATPMTAGDTEIVFTFTEPYTYEGGNLALMVYVSVEGAYTGDGYFYGVNADALGSAYGWASFFTQAFYPKTTFTYEDEGPANTVATLAEANALEDADDFAFNGDAVVTLFKNGYLFLRDESGYAQIKGVTGTFENSQVLSQGWSATKTTITDPWVRYIDAAGLSASGETNTDLAAAQKLTGAVDESMLNAYVYVENVTISSGSMPGMPMRSLPLPDGTSIGVTSTLWGMSWSASGAKNIYGVICKVDGKLQINVCEFKDYVAPPEFLRGDVNKDGEVKISDVTALINYLLNGDDSAIDLQAADCNEDGEIKIGDVTALINYLLTGAW